jgi:hypothetical protein
MSALLAADRFTAWNSGNEPTSRLMAAIQYTSPPAHAKKIAIAIAERQ